MPASADGAMQLRALGLRLKELGAAGDGFASVDLVSLGKGKTLRSQLLAGIRTGAKPAVEATRQAARDHLPKHGGLNTYVADTQIVVSNRLTGKRVGVRVGVKKGARHAYGANKGVIKHPTFGHRDRWDTQNLGSAAAGWFDRTMREQSPKVLVAVRAAMEAVAEEATRRL